MPQVTQPPVISLMRSSEQWLLNPCWLVMIWGLIRSFFLSKTCLDYHDLLESPIKRPVITIGDDSIRCVKKNGFRIRMISSLRKSHRRPAARRYSSRKSAWRCFIYGKHLPINLYSLDTCHIYLSVLSYGQEIVNEATQLPSAGPNSNMNRPVPTCGSTNCRFWKINIDLTFSFLSFKVYDCVDEYTVGFKWIYCRI